jgi:hypothetical protein
MLTELKAATMLRIDQPEPGQWNVRLTGWTFQRTWPNLFRSTPW